jgi:hypothetical protein
MKAYPLKEALRAQKALREAAGLAEEMFPIQAFVGMISDEVEVLRQRGLNDQQIADLIEANSEIRISAAEITDNYASSAERSQH